MFAIVADSPARDEGRGWKLGFTVVVECEKAKEGKAESEKKRWPSYLQLVHKAEIEGGPWALNQERKESPGLSAKLGALKVWNFIKGRRPGKHGRASFLIKTLLSRNKILPNWETMIMVH
jgi:hypothetical protein